ncbi:hypothetical protein P3T76_002382 [Phytophthora citrophthora]|uniref:Uncharacterized protein n=1 Tax=Phytophthora citrophthora TaxID=4793 RepID=A0AAD9GYL7_9STRA|nr:hypothetical protein P3T76_002382 [Phytophthora citrophthora]
MKVSATHHSTASSSLDAYDFEDASAATQGIVEACKRRNFRHQARAKRPQRNQQRVMSTNSPGATYQFANASSQDPAVFANLLADHFVAREASNAVVASPSASANSQQLVRPVAGTVGLGSFRSWQSGERCLATYRVLFGRPLWAATSSIPPASPRPRKRKHVLPPTSSEVNAGNELEMEASSGEMLVLPTVDELLELPVELDEAAEEDVLAGLAIDLGGLGTEAADVDGMDLLWDLDASDVGAAILTEGEEEELRFLTGVEDMEDI